MSIERLVLQGDDPAQSVPDPSPVAQAAERLQAGACVVLPTETGYGFAALPDRVDAIRGGDGDPSPTVLIADDHDAGVLPPRARRLADAFWPGPLTLIVDGPAGSTLGFRLPAHEFTRAVIRGCGGALAMSDVRGPDGAPLVTAEAISAQFPDAVELLVEHDASGRVSATVVRVTDDDLTIAREGSIPTASILAASPRTLLFVCTGNTCRSPLAAAIARAVLADRLGVAVDELTAHGYVVESAGVAAGFASPASENSVTAAAEIGLDLTAHRAQPVTHELLDRATHVFCLSESHAQAIAYERSDLVERIALLDPTGGVPDPFGGDLETYRRTRDHMRGAVEARVDELLRGS